MNDNELKQLLDYVKINSNEEESCKLIKRAFDEDNNNIQKALQQGNKGGIQDVLFWTLHYKRFKCFQLLIDYGFNPFIKSAIPVDDRLVNNVFEYLITITEDKKLIEPCLEHMVKLKSIEQIIDIPFHLLQEKYNLAFLPILREQVANEVESLQIDQDLKRQLKEFLNKKNVKIEGYPLLNRISVVAQLINYIKYPYSQDQGNQDTCGVNAVFIYMAIHAPNMLVAITLELLNKEYCHINNTVLYVNEKIKANCDSVAKVLNQAARNFLLNGEYSPNSSQDSTSGLEERYLLNKLGFTKQESWLLEDFNKFLAKNNDESISRPKSGINYNDIFMKLANSLDKFSLLTKPPRFNKFNYEFNWLANRSYYTYETVTIENLIDLIKKNQYMLATVYGNSHLMRKLTGATANNHALVISDINYSASKSITLTVYTWGKEIKIPDISLEEFLDSISSLRITNIPKKYKLLSYELSASKVTIDTDGNPTLQHKRPLKAKL